MTALPATDPRHPLEGADQIKAYVLAGRAIFTIQNEATEGRFTYRMVLDKDTGTYEVSVLTRADNNKDYTPFATIKEGIGKHDASHGIGVAAPSAVAFRWFWRVLNGRARSRTGDALSLDSFPTLKVWHEGRCGKCSRRLTVPASIASGLGPTCGAHG